MIKIAGYITVATKRIGSRKQYVIENIVDYEERIFDGYGHGQKMIRETADYLQEIEIGQTLIVSSAKTRRPVPRKAGNAMRELIYRSSGVPAVRSCA